MVYEHERRERVERDREAALMPTPDYRLKPLMFEYLTARGLDAGSAILNHWYPSTSAGDRERRIVMPATNRAGLAYWQGRLISGPETAKRYTSPPVSRGDSVIIVWPRVLKLRSVVVVTEGPMDALAAASTGLTGVALMGNRPALSALEHTMQLFSRAAFLVVPDKDSPESGGEWMSTFASYGRSASVWLPPQKDLAAIRPNLREALLFPVAEDLEGST